MYITPYGKEDLADVMRLKTLRQGDFHGLSGWVQSNHMSPIKPRVSRRNVMKEAIGEI